MIKTSIYVIVLCAVGGYVLQPLVHPLIVKNLGITVDEEKLQALVQQSKDQIAEAKEKVQSQGDADSAEPEQEAEVVMAGDDSEAEDAPEEPVLDNSVVGVMRSTLKENPTSRFSYDDVQEWHDVGEVRIEGKMYREGAIVVEMETILGKHPHRVQALIAGDTVVRWILLSTDESVL
ncbi:hypothetical protein [Rubritalea marina]|uniref:hypothetical protein n=1 Tax=Rubritalea marina TaxID=361055 RepID=UPI00037AFFFF|nr:hypothetical protein [Rubritalea marina]